MTADTLLADRAGALAADRTALLAALLAADTGTEGFLATDVRFFFLLFTNWIEGDQLRPDAELDLTQVRRVLVRLRTEGLAEGGAGGGAPRGARWRLTGRGVLRIAEELADPAPDRAFAEVVFVATIAALYAEVIAPRAGPEGGGAERRLRARFEPRRILRAERERLGAALVDLEARVRAGAELGAAARALRAQGLEPLEVAARLEAGGRSYQLRSVRPLPEVLAALPPGLRQVEVDRGIAFRARTLFQARAAELRGRILQLERLEAELGEG